MKEIVIYLSIVSKNKLFKPIRERKDIITILLESIRLLICNNPIPPKKACGKIILHKGKTNRIIYLTEKKYFSINFPFFIDNSDNYIIYDRNGLEIDSRVISILIELISENNIFNSDNFSSFFDAMETIYDEKKIWECFFHLLTFEEGYVRFDNDTEHIIVENHPQHHIDLFYKENNKIKFGLSNEIDSVSFHNLLNNNDFYFLNKSDNQQEPPHA